LVCDDSFTCGYHELLGHRQRYRILNPDRLLWALGRPGQLSDFRRWYAAMIDELASRADPAREALWSTAVAIGRRHWLNTLDRCLAAISQRNVVELSPTEQHVVAAEPDTSYGLTASRRTTDALLFPTSTRNEP